MTEGGSVGCFIPDFEQKARGMKKQERHHLVVVVTVAPTCNFLCTVGEEVLTEQGLSSYGLS